MTKRGCGKVLCTSCLCGIIMPRSDSSGKVPFKAGEIPYELKNQKEWDPHKNKPGSLRYTERTARIRPG